MQERNIHNILMKVLIRAGGRNWSAVLASRRRGGREVADQRILGDGDLSGSWVILGLMLRDILALRTLA
jgi:hypothetical protein